MVLHSNDISFCSSFFKKAIKKGAASQQTWGNHATASTGTHIAMLAPLAGGLSE
jgi:hypothetical protein